MRLLWILVSLVFVAPLFAAPGFSEHIEPAMKAAKRANQPILIDFYGIWCPPCNELDETVFETSEFLQKAKAFTLLKVDVDSQKSWALKDKYKIGGYPTILFLDPSGEEIYRIVGFLEKSQFIRVMDIVLKAKGKSLASSCASEDVEDLWRCSVISSEKKDTATLKKSLTKLEAKTAPGTARYEQVRTLQLENSDTEDLKRDGYEKLMTQFPSSPQAIIWASSYWELFSSGTLQPKKEIVEKVLSHYPAMSKDPKREELGIPVTDLAQYRADLLVKLGKAEEGKKAWKEAADLLDSLAKNLPKKFAARGFTLERIWALDNAGLKGEALALSERYRKRFPKEFTFHYTTANILEEGKRYKDALPIAEEAYRHSYGDNKIRVATLLVRLYAVFADKEKAKKVVNEVKDQFKPSPELGVRTHRYLAKLDEAYFKLLAQ